MYWYSRHLCSINLGGPSAKVGSSAKFGVAILKAFILDSLWGSIRQSMFVCQVLCTGIQGIHPQFTGGSICQSMFVCQILCTGIQGIYALLIWGGPSAKVGFCAKFGVAIFKAFILDSLWGSICQSMFVCQVECTGIQSIYAVLMGDPLAKVGSSAKFGAVVFKAFMLNILGGASAKVCLSAKFCVLVFKASLLYYPGGLSAKVCLSTKFCVLVFKASMLY